MSNVQPPQGQSPYAPPPQGAPQQYAPQGYPQGQQPWPHVPPAPPVPEKKRSWFGRHKILTTLGIIVVSLVLISAINGAGGDNTAADTSGDPAAKGAPAADGKPAAEEKEPAKPGLNTPVTSGDIEFTVTKIEKGVKSVGSEDFGQKAQGQYVLVSVSMKNVGKEGITVWDTQKLKDDQDRTFEADSMAAVYIKDNDAWLTQINPGNTAKGVMVFDMATDAKPISILLQGGMLDQEVEVTLG